MKFFSSIKKLNQKGFSHVEFFLVLVVVVAVGGIGFYVYKNSTDSTKESSAASEPVIAVAAPIPNRLESGPIRTAFKDQINARAAVEAPRTTVMPTCDGDKGTRGARVELVWVDGKNFLDKQANIREAKSDIRKIAAGVDSVFIESAKTQNTRYMVRWPRDSKCNIKVRTLGLKQKDFEKLQFALKGGPQNKNPEKAYKILRRAGLDQNSRKYMVFTRVTNKIKMCGYDFMPFQDDRPGQENKNNRLSSMQIINRQCWIGKGDADQAKKIDMFVQNAAFQLVHTLGGPQKSAPNAFKIDGSFLGDGAEKLKFVYNVTQYDDLLGYYGPLEHEKSEDCETTATNLRAVMLDCGNDDYFNTLGDTISDENYLKTHWNIANSRFIEKVPNNTP